MTQAGPQELGYTPYTRNGDEGSYDHAVSWAHVAMSVTDRPRAEASLWAYCRELCGPAACDEAVGEILRSLEDGPAGLSEDDLLRLTRETAARFAETAANGSSDEPCAQTPARLAAYAGGALAPSARRELAEHLEGCLACKALQLKHDRAERGYATLWERAQALQPAPDTIEPSAASASASASADPAEAVEPGGLGEPGEPGGPGEPTPARAVNPGSAKAAVQAYCRELCGSIGARRAVEERLAAAGIGVGTATVAEDKLLRMTRLAVADQVAAGIRADRRRDKSSTPASRACADTPTRLAAIANAELDPDNGRELTRHLRHCLICQAVAIRMERAERAFSIMATLTDAPKRRSEPRVEPAAAAAATVAAAAAAVETAAVAAAAPPAPPAPPAPAPAAGPAPAAAPPEAPGPPEAPAPAAGPPAPAPPAVKPDPGPGTSGFIVPPPSAVRRPIVEPPRRPAAPAVEPRRARGAPARAPRRPSRARTPAAESRQPPRKRGAVAILGPLIAVAAALALGAVLVLSGRSSPAPVVPAVHALTTTPAASSASGAGHAAASRHVAKSTPTRHHIATEAHRATKPHRATKAHRAAPPKHHSVAPSAPASHPVVAPVVPRRVIPVVARPSTPAPQKSNPPSVTPQGTNLPAQNAPTKGIGSGG